MMYSIENKYNNYYYNVLINIFIAFSSNNVNNMFIMICTCNVLEQ